MTAAYVNYTVENNIGVIEFFTPQHNSLPGEVLEKIAATIKAAGEDDKSRVLILKSGGDRTFCAGASFDELMEIENETQGTRFFCGFANVINAMRKCPKLIIGRVQGKAIGGGVGVASACDYTFATKYADIKLSELAVGIGPFVVGPAVERKMGHSAFSQLAIDASSLRSAQWAKEHGLYADVFDSIADMDKAIEVLAKTLSESSPAAMAELKKIFWEDAHHWDELLAERAGVSGRLVLSEHSKNAISKFKGK